MTIWTRNPLTSLSIVVVALACLGTPAWAQVEDGSEVYEDTDVDAWAEDGYEGYDWDADDVPGVSGPGPDIFADGEAAEMEREDYDTDLEDEYPAYYGDRFTGAEWDEWF